MHREKPFTQSLTLRLQIIISLCVLTIIGAACAQKASEITLVTETPTAAIILSAAPTQTPQPTETPTTTPTPGPMTPSQIFAHISASIAFIETSIGTGSGVLIEGNYILTNAHVVWPFEQVRIVFPDGSEYIDAPVKNMDLMADLAIVGPIETENPTVALVDGEELIVGSDVYLIGYPGEVDKFPQPTITRGLISRIREWEAVDITYFQSDATITGGQSGGALISDRGELIGISGFYFTEAEFALVASASDILPRVQKMIAGEDVAGLGEWRLPASSGNKWATVILDGEWDTSTYVIREPAGTDIAIELDGISDGGFILSDIYGHTELYVNETYTRNEQGKTTLDIDAPFFLRVFQTSYSREFFTLKTNLELTPYRDEEDGFYMATGQVKKAILNYPGDQDFFSITLMADEVINIRVDSILFDPYLLIFPEGSIDIQSTIVIDNDSGGGLFGTNAELTFKASHAGVYNIVVADLYGDRVGGYFLTIDEPYIDAPTPSAPPPTPTPIASSFGPMARYESANGHFSIQYPTNWEPSTTDISQLCKSNVATCFTVPEQGYFMFMVEDLSKLGLDNITLDEYVDRYLSPLSESVSLESREPFTTEQGFVGTLLTLSVSDLAMNFICIKDNYVINITYFAPLEQFNEQQPLIKYILGTLSRE